VSQPGWTTPADLRAQLQRLWERGDLLRARLPGTPALFPLQLRLKKPGSQDLAVRFEDVRHWISQLQQADDRYRLEWKAINHRQLGRNLVPDSIWVDQPDAALGLLGQRLAAQQFDALLRASLDAFPALLPWLQRQPLRALEKAEHWPKVLAVLAWFQSHPNCGLYLRQLDIPGVDTKFIEQRRGLLGELLDLVLPDASLDRDARGARLFERRYGLRDKPVRARMRLLDPALYIDGLSDLELHHRERNQLPRLPGAPQQRHPVRPGLCAGPPRRHPLAARSTTSLLGRHRHPWFRHPRSPSRAPAAYPVVTDGSRHPATASFVMGMRTSGQALPT